MKNILIALAILCLFSCKEEINTNSFIIGEWELIEENCPAMVQYQYIKIDKKRFIVFSYEIILNHIYLSNNDYPSYEIIKLTGNEITIRNIRLDCNLIYLKK